MMSKLKRSISFPLLFLYGLGTMVGGGFYALSGKIAGEADMATPISFLVAGMIAFLNVFTFSELSARYPVSAGEAKYVEKAFNSSWFSNLVGWLVILTGVVSSATLTIATVGFLQDLFTFRDGPGVFILVLLMVGISVWGVGESVKAVIGITLVEVGALIFIVFAKGSNVQAFSGFVMDTSSFFPEGFPFIGVLAGAYLAFYAFVGFEDMVNMAEEVKNVKKALPKAMQWAVIVTTILYVLVSATMVTTVTPLELSEATAPIARVIEEDGEFVHKFFILVSILTGINGALVQIVMASRILYGLGNRNPVLAVFSKVNRNTQTPIYATVFVGLVILILALFFPLVGLAETTSFIILIIFAVLNISLIRIKRSEIEAPKDIRIYPVWLPAISFLTCLGILVFKIFDL